MKTKSLLLAILLSFCFSISAQHTVISFKEAESKGISITQLDKDYMSAIHANTDLAVFKSAEGQKNMQIAYIKLLQDLGSYLYQNKFNWEKPTRCFNRIYFSKDGEIDYFLYNFTSNSKDAPSVEMQKEFERLLTQFVQNYKIPITANVKFAQCSPVTYMPMQDKVEK